MNDVAHWNNIEKSCRQEQEEFIDQEDYLYHVGWFSHKPKEGYPRKGHVQEHVYAEKWEALMRKIPRYGLRAPNGMLASVLYQLPVYITQRHALVCATVVCWLGTNCGQSVLHKAEQFMIKAAMFSEQAYLLAWTSENMRHSWLNHGYKTIEHLLAPADHYGVSILTPFISLIRKPKLTIEDYETVECLMQWLGSKEGQQFISECELEISEIERLTAKARKIGATL
jgi:hypothetical protein